MIMKRIDTDDDQLPWPVTQPAWSESKVADNSFVPGLMYRGVPQDRRRLLLRIDSARSPGTPIASPFWLTARRTHSEIGLSELFFG